jgi:hypothetical protein
MYEYFATIKPDDCVFTSGAVSTKNPILSLFFSTTYNIRKKDLISAYERSKELLVFPSQKRMLNYVDQHPVFPGTNICHFETAPIFKVASEYPINFEDKIFVTIKSQNLKLIGGKLRNLDYDYKISIDVPCADLSPEVPAEEIIHPSFTNCTIS